MRKIALKIGLGFLVFGSIYAILIFGFDIIIPCFYYETYGIKCPGCGVTRMFLSIYYGDFVAAFAYNPVMFILFFVWFVVWFLWVWDKFEFVKKKIFIKALIWISSIAVIIYAIVRNLV